MLDVSLLKKARELVDSIGPVCWYGVHDDLEELMRVVIRMWESACICSETHQDILAVFENGVRSAAQTGSVTKGQLAAFRAALNDLGRSRLVRENAEAMRARFRQVGFMPLAFIGPSDEAEEIRELRRIVEEVDAEDCVEFVTT